MQLHLETGDGILKLDTQEIAENILDFILNAPSMTELALSRARTVEAITGIIDCHITADGTKLPVSH